MEQTFTKLNPKAQDSHGVYTFKTSRGAVLSVCVYGATIYELIPAGADKSVLFLSEQTSKSGDKPLRGGIPVVFPVFGSDPSVDLPSHGFARRTVWYLESAVEADDSLRVVFTLNSDQLKYQRPTFSESWSYSFELRLEIKLSLDGRSLQTNLNIINAEKGEMGRSFNFQALLHTYYALDKIKAAEVKFLGLKEINFIDKTDGNSTKEVKAVEEAPVVNVAKETDSVFKTPILPRNIVELNDTEKAKSIATLEYKFFKDDFKYPCSAVVWNPWAEKASSMGDFGDEEYKKMICVEPGSVSGFTTIYPGETYILSQNIAFQ